MDRSPWGYGKRVVIDAHPVREYDQIGKRRVPGGRRQEPLAGGHPVQVFTKLLRRSRRRRGNVGGAGGAQRVIHPVPGQFLDGGLDSRPFGLGPQISDAVKPHVNLRDVPSSGDVSDRPRTRMAEQRSYFKQRGASVRREVQHGKARLGLFESALCRAGVPPRQRCPCMRPGYRAIPLHSGITRPRQGMQGQSSDGASHEKAPSSMASRRLDTSRTRSASMSASSKNRLGVTSPNNGLGRSIQSSNASEIPFPSMLSCGLY